MTRSTICAVLLTGLLGVGVAHAFSGDGRDSPKRDWRGKFCANCQTTSDGPASRVIVDPKIATKLAAPNTCADPGSDAWFAEEEDHLTAFLNSTPSQLK
jgi:hypothetical protein